MQTNNTLYRTAGINPCSPASHQATSTAPYPLPHFLHTLLIAAHLVRRIGEIDRDVIIHDDLVPLPLAHSTSSYAQTAAVQFTEMRKHVVSIGVEGRKLTIAHFVLHALLTAYVEMPLPTSFRKMVEGDIEGRTKSSSLPFCSTSMLVI